MVLYIRFCPQTTCVVTVLLLPNECKHLVPAFSICLPAVYPLTCSEAVATHQQKGQQEEDHCAYKTEDSMDKMGW